MRVLVVMLLLVLGPLLLPGFAQTSPGYQTITTEELGEMLNSPKDVDLINVHVPYEGELPQTDAFIQFDKIAENLDLLPSQKDAPIVLYCKSGRMSEIAAAELVRLGYTNVSHVEGGFDAWANSGRQLLQQ